MSLLLQIVLSNVVISLGLAVLAWIVGTMTQRPKLSYLLWLLVLVKLVTPPVYSPPVLTIPAQTELSATSTQAGPESGASLFGIEGAINTTASWITAANSSYSVLLLIWLSGSLLVLALSAVRIFRFSRLLKKDTREASVELRATAEQLAARLHLKRVPAIFTTTALISPLVWWTGGKVRVVLPVKLVAQMDSDRFRWILAHELTHVLRKDYLVRWIEWAVVVCFWWNPVVYWARHNLRIQEEYCCDALVISSLEGNRRSYADSLLKALELISRPACPAPAFASELNSGDFLKQRFSAIISGKPLRAGISRLQTAILGCLVVLLPFGIGYEVSQLAVAAPVHVKASATDLEGIATEGITRSTGANTEAIAGLHAIDGEHSEFEQAEPAADKTTGAASASPSGGDHSKVARVHEVGCGKSSDTEEQAEANSDHPLEVAALEGSGFIEGHREDPGTGGSRLNPEGRGDGSDTGEMEQPERSEDENVRLEHPDQPGSENRSPDPNRLEPPGRPGIGGDGPDPDRLQQPRRSEGPGGRGGRRGDHPGGGGGRGGGDGDGPGGDDGTGGHDGEGPGGGGDDHGGHDGNGPGSGGDTGGHDGEGPGDQVEDRISEIGYRFPDQEEQYSRIDSHPFYDDQPSDGKYGQVLLEDDRYDVRDGRDLYDDARYDARDYQEHDFYDRADERDDRDDSRCYREGKSSKR